MSSNNEGNVEEKFFFNPDLMEKLLPFMDSHSVLLQSKISCAFVILKNRNNPSVWKKMIDRKLQTWMWTCCMRRGPRLCP